MWVRKCCFRLITVLYCFVLYNSVMILCLVWLSCFELPNNHIICVLHMCLIRTDKHEAFRGSMVLLVVTSLRNDISILICFLFGILPNSKIFMILITIQAASYNLALVIREEFCPRVQFRTYFR